MPETNTPTTQSEDECAILPVWTYDIHDAQAYLGHKDCDYQGEDGKQQYYATRWGIPARDLLVGQNLDVGQVKTETQSFPTAYGRPDARSRIFLNHGKMRFDGKDGKSNACTFLPFDCYAVYGAVLDGEKLTPFPSAHRLITKRNPEVSWRGYMVGGIANHQDRPLRGVIYTEAHRFQIADDDYAFEFLEQRMATVSLWLDRARTATEWDVLRMRIRRFYNVEYMHSEGWEQRVAAWSKRIGEHDGWSNELDEGWESLINRATVLFGQLCTRASPEILAEYAKRKQEAAARNRRHLEDRDMRKWY